MKKLISISFMLAMICVATTSFAQGFGVKGSLNFFNLAMKDINGDKIENKMIPTFDAGVFGEFAIADEFYIRPELLFANKGAKLEGTDEKVSLGYLEVPVLFLYKGGLGSSKVLLGFGPYLAYGITGDYFKDDTFKPFDMGGKMMFGFEFGGGLSAALNASYGLMDILEHESDASAKNVGFGLTLGYRFGK